MDPRLILLIAMLGGAILLLVLALAGPSAAKAQARRLAAVMGRHSSAA